MNNCSHCAAQLFTAVPHCPYCGTATGAEPVARPADKPKPAAAPPAPPVQPAVAAAVPPRPPAAVPAAAAPVAVAPAVMAPVTEPASPAPAPAPARQQPAGDTRPAKPRSWGKVLVGLLLVAGVLSYLGRKPAADDTACNAAFDSGTKLIANGDLAGARAQSLQAHALCVNAARAKADTLQAALEEAEKAGNACVRSLNAIGSQLEDHQLNTARANLDQLGSSCTAMPAAGKLRQDLTRAQAGANAALQSTRQAIAARNIGEARQALTRLAEFNREAADLGRLGADIDKLESEIAAAAAPPPPAPAAPAVVAAQPAAVAPPPKAVEAHVTKPEPANNAKAEMAQSFVRDAEAAMGQRKFDTARTYLDSARRMDPSNPRLDSLAQQIRERERQLLQQETTIR